MLGDHSLSLRAAQYCRMIDLLKHESSSLDKINTREIGWRVLTNDTSNGALTSPDSRVPTLLNNYTIPCNCGFVVKVFKGWWEGKRKPQSPKCNFPADDGGIGTIDGAGWMGSASCWLLDASQ